MVEKTANSVVDHAWTLGGRALIDGLVAGGEFYMAEDDALGGPTQPLGFYIFLTQRWNDVEAGGRFQYYDQDSGATGGSEITSIDLKGSYYLGEGKGYNAPRVTLLYSIRDADSGYTGAGSNIFDEKGSVTAGNDVNNVLIVELSVPF